MKCKQFLLVAAALAGSPASAAPPDVIYRFDVISETVTFGGQPCTPSSTFPCVPPHAPYELATLELTHQAFAPNHAAQLETGPAGTTVDDGVIAFTTFLAPPGSELNFPPSISFQRVYSATINVQISGVELSGQMSAETVTHGGCYISMMSGVDENWVGQRICPDSFFVTHNFIATVTRVPPGIASR